MGGLVVAALILPVAPINSTWWREHDAASEQLKMQIGWPQIASTVAQVRDAFSAADRVSASLSPP